MKRRRHRNRKKYGSGVRYQTGVKSVGFRFQLEAFCVSSHTTKAWYYEWVCRWMTICILSTWVEPSGREFAGYHIRWNAIALLKNWVHPVAENIYIKIYVKNSFTNVKNNDGSRVRYLTNVKLAEFRSQLAVSRVSSHIEELWYNETACLWMTIYIYIYIYIYTLRRKTLKDEKIMKEVEKNR